MSNLTKNFKTIISILSFILACALAIFWFLLTYWKFPSYSSSTTAYFKYGVTGFSSFIEHTLKFIAFSPLIIAAVMVFIEFSLLKRKNKVLKLCLSLVILFTASICSIHILVAQGRIFINNFSTPNWENIEQLRYKSVNNLIDTHKLVGMTTPSLMNLLGPDDYTTQNFNSISYFWDLTNPLSINNKYLKITASDGKVSTYEIVQN